ncbi:hypothetical protein CEQ21_07200 (plasmid) [Niallia circulans]|uniref:Uncharacterized protein n=1 Tax=Niallia circulans TaxID=1397 RepID=A0A553SQS7_NIACI|nr:hypothetical protein [Niallia circulans]TRZ39340.1 hypothetical protein CEQ21_07200 [Niallia circulans]
MKSILSYWIGEMNKQGISNNHIKAMKDRILISESDYHLYYDEVNNNKLPTLVEVSKIQGISGGWVTENRSIYELFFSVTREISTNGRGSLHSQRIQQNVDSLINNGLEYQYKFYIDDSIEYRLRDGLPKFNYYMDDEVYFSNATHRTVSAIMFNAPMMVGYLTKYKKNPLKFNNYLLNKETKNQWVAFLDTLSGLNIKKSSLDQYGIQLKNSPTDIKFYFHNPLITANYENLNYPELFMNEKRRVEEIIKKLEEVNTLLVISSVKSGVLPLPFRLLKKFKLRLTYDFFMDFYKIENHYFDLNDSPNIIVEKIHNLVRAKLIKDNAPRY